MRAMLIRGLGIANTFACPTGQQPIVETCNGTAPLSPSGKAACDSLFTTGPGGILISKSTGMPLGGAIAEVQSGCQATAASLFNAPTQLLIGDVGLGGAGMAMIVNVGVWLGVGLLLYSFLKK